LGYVHNQNHPFVISKCRQLVSSTVKKKQNRFLEGNPSRIISILDKIS
ncbi:hypothetical protein CDAR_532961, partial [Caerostris darwini]